MINIYKLKLTILQQEILRFLFANNGKTFNARNLAKALKVSQPAISKALPKLKKEEYITINKDKESKRLSLNLNPEYPSITGIKRAENLKLFYESGLAHFLLNRFPGTTIILFGSYSRGDDIFKSDIDIAIIGKKSIDIDLTKFEEILNKEIILQFYSNFKEIHKHLKENIYNGIVISGGIELWNFQNPLKHIFLIIL